MLRFQKADAGPRRRLVQSPRRLGRQLLAQCGAEGRDERPAQTSGGVSAIRRETPGPPRLTLMSEPSASAGSGLCRQNASGSASPSPRRGAVPAPRLSVHRGSPPLRRGCCVRRRRL